jgi:lysophospholipase L1-like esterase
MNRILAIFSAILLSSALMGQDEMGTIALKYPFLDTSKNHLEFYGERTGMDRLYEKLDRVIFEGQGKVNIVHVGGSHVQGGTLSHTLRMHMGQLAPELGVERGFLFPHRLANTNMPRNIYVKKIGTWEGCRNSIPRNQCPWGVSGIDAITRDPEAAFILQSFADGSKTSGFTEWRIFEHMSTNTMSPVVHPKPDSSALDEKAGVRRYFYAESQDSVYVTFDQGSGAPLYTLQGIQMVRDEPGVVYHALGVNGASTKSFLRSENFIEQAAYLAPDLVIFGLGINDAYKLDSEWRPEEYKMRYDTLVQWFRSVNPECEFIFMTNNDSYYKRRVPNEHALDVVREMKRLSREHNTGFWDLFGVMGGLNSIALWEENGLAKSDKVHFTRKGYTLNSDLLFWAFWEDYEKHLKKLAD